MSSSPSAASCRAETLPECEAPRMMFGAPISTPRPARFEAAAASKRAGLGVLMGAPNIMRGASHSGNVSARQLAADGLLDILSSDYIPFSLIQSAFFLGDAVETISLPQAVAMGSKNPAEALGLDDRGVIEAGRRADLVRVRVDDHVPVVRTVWREGRRVA